MAIAPATTPVRPAEMCGTSSAANNSDGRSPTNCLSRSSTSGMQLAAADRDRARATINDYQLACFQAAGGVSSSDHRWDAVLTRDERGVGGQCAPVGDDRRRAFKQRRPGRGGGSRNEHLASFERVEVLDAAHEPHAARGTTRTGALADQQILRYIGPTDSRCCPIHQRREQAGWMAQLERSNQATLPLPLVTSVSDGIREVRCGMLEFGTGQEERVFGTPWRICIQQAFTQAEHGPPKQRPTQGEPARLLLTDRRIPLGHLEQAVETRPLRRSVHQRSTARGLRGLPFRN